jgi:hypothetical protein
MMSIHKDLRKAWYLISEPEATFDREREVEGYWPVLRFYLVLNVILAVLTPIVNWLHIPSDIVHAGTNAQMGAYAQAPLLEAITGISRYAWVAILTYLGNIAKFPILGGIMHVFALILRGNGTFLDSLKVSVYAAAPVLLFGWIPYFGLISGLWVGYLYVVGFWRLHNISMGRAIALVNLMIGVQLVWAFLLGWIGSSEPW